MVNPHEYVTILLKVLYHSFSNAMLINRSGNHNKVGDILKLIHKIINILKIPY